MRVRGLNAKRNPRSPGTLVEMGGGGGSRGREKKKIYQRNLLKEESTEGHTFPQLEMWGKNFAVEPLRGPINTAGVAGPNIWEGGEQGGLGIACGKVLGKGKGQGKH